MMINFRVRFAINNKPIQQMANKLSQTIWVLQRSQSKSKLEAESNMKRLGNAMDQLASLQNKVKGNRFISNERWN